MRRPRFHGWIGERCATAFVDAILSLTIYGLEGVSTWTVDGKPIDVGPGQALCIPHGAIHRFDNNGSQDVHALCVITPSAIGPQYFHVVAEVTNAAAGGPPDRTKIAEIMIRHGVTPAPPRLSLLKRPFVLQSLHLPRTKNRLLGDALCADFGAADAPKPDPIADRPAP